MSHRNPDIRRFTYLGGKMKTATTSDAPPLNGLRGLISDGRAAGLLKPLQTPRAFPREPVMLEFPGLPDDGVQLETGPGTVRVAGEEKRRRPA
jgi:hypothetical protein